MEEASAVTRLAYSAYLLVSFNMSRLKVAYATCVIALAVACLALWYVFVFPPPLFPAGKVITVEEGMTLPELADTLQSEGVIRSARAFAILARLRGGAESMQSGKYVFARPAGLWRVEERVQDGRHGITATRVVFIEGATVHDMARILKKAFPSFDDAGFLSEALPLEGYLFPDTYFFYPDVTPHDVIVAMYANFMSHEGDIEGEVDAFGRPLKDDVIMASLLEREAKTLADKRMVAGVLWNRVQKGMPLQVDAVFGYINDVPTYSPKASDLAIDSPYNTYKNKGLPPGPIGNPGIVSLLAAVTPATTTDLYYLTGRDGTMHYAATFEQHKANRAKYLD
jgi:UPF0755 protein